MDENYVKKLENVIKQMIRPLKEIPFNLVIEAISNYRVIPFDYKDERDKKVLDTLINAVKIAGKNINKNGIMRPRANEVGNDIEKYIKDALNELGYKAETPITRSGRRRSTGYPDLQFIDEFNRVNYLECKTFNIKNINTTQRSFYLSPSEDFKIISDAHHFAISLEMYVDDVKGVNKIFKCSSWKILSLENLTLDVKYEFQSDNRRLYSKELILSEGKF
ncbi:MAG: hypothetical protein ACTSQP_21190 [Promethearchaeota archaeon]